MTLPPRGVASYRVEITPLLRRPDETVASNIAGSGDNLSLTYFITQREVDDSLAAKNATGLKSVSRSAAMALVTG